MMWVLAVNGLVYLAFIYLHGEWRDLVPRRGDIRDSGRWSSSTFRCGRIIRARGNTTRSRGGVLLDARLRRARGDHGARDLETGAARVAHESVGGYVWARYWHFLVMLALVALAVGHVFMVFAVDPYSLRVDDHGRLQREELTGARNARPFVSSAAEEGRMKE